CPASTGGANQPALAHVLAEPRSESIKPERVELAGIDAGDDGSDKTLGRALADAIPGHRADRRVRGGGTPRAHQVRRRARSSAPPEHPAHIARKRLGGDAEP